MADLDSLSCLVEQTRSAVVSARLTSAELWRRAVLEGRATHDDARAADARCAALESDLTSAERALGEARDAADRVITTCAAIRDALKKQGPLPTEKIARSTGLGFGTIGRAVSGMLSRGELVRCVTTGALALA